MKKRKRDIFKDYGASLVKDETGEILSRDVIDSLIRQEKSEEIKALYNKFNNDEDLEFEEIIQLSRLMWKNGIKLEEYSGFVDYYTVDTMAMINLSKKLSGDATKACIGLTEFVKGNNTLQLQGNKNITKDQEFADALNLDIRKWRNLKKELIQNRAIKKLKFDEITMYKLNPMIIGRSMKISLCSYYAFRDELKKSMPKLKILYWDKKLLEEFGVEALNNKRRFSK